ncbi:MULTISPECIES: D-alanyl-D-alanine carboxypeptidase family protein [Achromobacter]|uniref:serine-type D-Ala-D-Ala carboxypeptidase n=1 Tax=Alcaligenes xylosoxydans xylosoxydans TaxID=85698 RepID=A0A424W4W2_ALCXX|nr:MULTISPECIES: D-alanyl-D-alanine carboxypeptidase family protein [Achromobacter]MBC9908548.1 D-alanyl-D-alanine carboxypeptidase [Achromobacter xylosoxidans]MBD0872499.1 D-alanyl-D-alanine carboxypeptidase [Achromobacter xylosoxidans]MDH1300547.1 D-alanyl-D-alanine carboxypeptidase [Achromobacter sp. GD03932]QNP87512.1 D-alanyl-D-alanine carboxypeptidase [Achromobacter xylosoxidans]RPJ88218.1 D-alanyl-D-alanine carboxypeptidase [Achromobacter xylosoxidans]
MLMKKLAASLIVAAACMSGAVAQTVPAPALSAKAWLLLDETSGQVIASHAATTRIEPASLTKIMTAYVVFEALSKKELSAAQMVTVSTRAWKVPAGSSKMFLEPGSKVSVDDLLRGLMIQSGNDAAIALAEAVSGSVEAFVARMNETAARLGLHATHFASPHGLPDPGTYSTASDLSVLATRYIRDFPQLYKTYDSAKHFTYNKITQPNRNRLLWLDPSVDGLKTGHTESAGFCIVATAQRPNGADQRRLITVVVGTASDKLRTQESRELLEWGFQGFNTIKLYARGQAVATPEVWKGEQDSLKAGFARDAYVTVPAGAKVEPVWTPQDPLIAPIAAQSAVGAVRVLVDGKPAMQFPVVALEPVAEAGFAGRAWDSIRLWWRGHAG